MTYTKTEWRERLLRTRRSIDPDARSEASARVVARLVALAEFRRARSVLLYVATGAELDVAALAAHAGRAGKQVYRPATDVPPPHWTSTAPAAAPDAPAPPILLVAPAVALDVHGRRLGRGGGYYDRAIADLRRTADVVVAGVAFDAQVVDVLPDDPWDQAVDLVVTERRLMRCEPPGAPAHRRSGGSG